MLTKNLAKRLALTGAFILCLAGWQGSAQADDFYIGAGAYQADVDFDGFDDDDTVTAFTLGYYFIDSSLFMLAGELSRYDLGSYSGPGIDIDSEATSLAAVLYLPLGPFIELYAKTGVASIDSEINNVSSDDTESFSGVGIGLDLLDTVDFYAEFVTFDSDTDSELFGVGVRLDF